MYRIALFAIVAQVSCSACSVYDVAALSADAALNLFTDVNDDKDDTDSDPYNDRYRIWSYDVSNCIRSETKRQDLDRQLDMMFESIEDGHSYVLLPTGEKYAIDSSTSSMPSLNGPTATCISDTSDLSQ